MTSKLKKRPSPDELLAEVRGRGPAKTYQFDDYLPVVDEMQKKNFSYAKIAEFLSERLGYPIARGQVYRAYQLWLEAQADAEREREEAERLQGEEPPEFPSEEDERITAINRAAGNMLKLAREKYPDGSVPFEIRDVFKCALAFLDDEVRDDYAAEQADKRMTRENNESSDAGTH